MVNKQTGRNIFAVVIPTYNNSETLAAVVEEVKSICPVVIVVNDGSTDSTRDVLESIKGIDVITHSRNRGKGPAIGSGFARAAALGATHVITIDSDGQHFPSEIVSLAEASDREPETLWIGARTFGCENMPGKNTFANRFSNFWFRVETGVKLEDTQSGFRCYPLSAVKGMTIFSGRYEWELEIIVRASWRGVPVKNLPVNVYYPPPAERISHFKPLRDFARISVLNTVLVFVSLLWVYPVKFVRWFNKDNITAFIKKHITESRESNLHIAKSVGLGLFFGISPLWGYQMLAAVATAHLLKLNKVITLVSSNISIPPMIPFILYGSFAAGAYILGEPVKLIPSELTLESISVSLKQYLIGSVAFAAVAGIAGLAISYLFLSIFRKPLK